MARRPDRLYNSSSRRPARYQTIVRNIFLFALCGADHFSFCDLIRSQSCNTISLGGFHSDVKPQADEKCPFASPLAREGRYQSRIGRSVSTAPEIAPWREVYGGQVANKCRKWKSTFTFLGKHRLADAKEITYITYQLLFLALKTISHLIYTNSISNYHLLHSQSTDLPEPFI